MKTTVALLALAPVACSSAQYAPLTIANPLRCESLRVSLASEEIKAAVSRDAPRAPDPLLDWHSEMTALAGPCAAPNDRAAAGYCKWAFRQELLYTALHEPPLTRGISGIVFRGVYRPAFGPVVVVRVVFQNDEAVLVAKSLNSSSASISWTTARKLSRAEWAMLRDSAANLPRGRGEYFPEPRTFLKSLEPPPSSIRLSPQSSCFAFDRASVQVERVENGQIDILQTPYERSGEPSCELRAHAASRFFDTLVALVDCSPAPEPE